MAKRNRNRPQGGVRFARVPSGGETCPFCIMLASRGAVYYSEKTAGADGHYHANCRCRIVPSWNGAAIEGYDPDRYYDMWKHPEKYAKPEDGTSVAAELAEQVTKPTHDYAVYDALTEEQKAAITEVVDSSDTEAAEVYAMFEKDMKLASTTTKRAHYDPVGNAVNLDVGRVIRGGGIYWPNEIWYHEFGHWIDYNAVDKGKLPTRLSGRRMACVSEAFKLGDSVKNDIFAALETMRKDFQDRYSSLLDGMSESELAEAYRSMTGREVAFGGYEYGKAIFGSAEFLKKKMRTVLDDPIDRWYQLSFWGEVFGNMLKRDYPDEANRSDISDMFEAATGTSLGCGGHGDSYWNTAPDNRHTEAFAEMMSAELTNPKSWEIMEKYLPNAVDEYHTILRRILDGDAAEKGFK